MRKAKPFRVFCTAWRTVCRTMIAVLLLSIASGERIASACGITLHMFMGDAAIQRVKYPELEHFLKKHRNALRNGTIFPDSGYVFKNSYGEFAHWETFLNPLAQKLDQTCRWPLNKECQDNFAFFLGSLAHSLGDVNFDRYFVTEVANQSFNGSLQNSQDYTDPGMDMLVILEYNRGVVIPQKWAPVELLSEALALGGNPVPAQTLQTTTDFLFAALVGERAAAPLSYLYYKLTSPWAAANYIDARGGLRDSADQIASIWDRVWEVVMTDRSFSRLAFQSWGGWPNVNFDLR